MTENLQKKKQIDAILKKYRLEISELRKERDKVISTFLTALKEKKLEKMRNAIKES